MGWVGYVFEFYYIYLYKTPPSKLILVHPRSWLFPSLCSSILCNLEAEIAGMLDPVYICHVICHVLVRIQTFVYIHVHVITYKNLRVLFRTIDELKKRHEL